VGGTLLGARTPARVAVLFDWDSWWALEMADGPNRLVRYVDVLVAWYKALWVHGVPMDVVPVTAALGGYDMVLAPLLHMIKGDIADRLAAVVARGGTVVTGFLSGHVDESANTFPTDDPGPLAALAGVRVDETDAREPGVTVPLRLASGARLGDGGMVFDLLHPDDGTEVVASYDGEWFAGQPAVTRRVDPSSGEAWYIGTDLDEAGLEAVIAGAARRFGFVDAAQPGVERAVRLMADGRTANFVLNHNDTPVEVTADGEDLLSGRTVNKTMTLEPRGVAIVVE